ncbi:MAG: general secretion pathway protein K [Oleiphilaceae bacterium]|jgi:general secretion pathway protein K
MIMQRSNEFKFPSKQKGVALMLVIFVFALVSILAVGMYNRQHIFVQTAGNVMAQAQAYQYAIASEVYGKRLLKADWDEDKEKGELVDDLEQVQNSILLPVEEAFLEAQFNDVQGKLNINDLVNLSGNVNAIMKDRFDRLLKRLAIETIKVEVIIDWLDENQDPQGFEGIEDGEYLSQDPPYRNAGQSIRDISELRLLPNVSNEDFQKILPHVTVLPMGRATINVNTATEEVLQSLTATLSDSQAKTLAEQKEEKPWKTLADFQSDPLISTSGLTADYLGVNSEFFEIATRITLSDRVVRLVSLIYRNSTDGVMQLISRDQSQKYLITKEKVTL